MSEYDGPKHIRLTKRLRKIAHFHGMKVRFKRHVGFEAEYWVGYDMAVIQLDSRSNHLISNFFHELGHHLDFKNGKFKAFYSYRTPLKEQRKISLRAERHADKVGEALCKLHFPKIKFRKSYVSKEDIQFNIDYYADKRYSTS